MNLKYVIAIVGPQCVAELEAQFARIGIEGITLTKVKGFGEYKNFFRDDWLSDHTKIEILTDESRVPALLEVLMKTAGSSLPGSGVVAIVPVDSVMPLRTHRGSAINDCAA
jgi:nitrogen regulatory protein P-II 1